MTEAEELELLELERARSIAQPPTPSMGAAGHEAQGAFGEQEQEPTRSNLFPSAVKEYEDRFSQPAGSIGQSVRDFGAVGMAAAGDLVGTAQRGAAALFTDQRMSDPGAHALKPQTDAAVEDAKSHLGGYRDVPYPSGPDMGPQMGPAMVEIAGRTIDDPLTWVTPFLKGIQVMGRGGLAAIEKAAPGFTKATEAMSRWNGRSSEKLSGVPLETLRANADPAKRAMMKANYGQEDEIGKEFLDKFSDPEKYLEEVKTLKESSKNLPPLSTESAVRAMEGALPRPIQGFSPNEVGAYTDVERSAIAKAKPNIDFIRGGEKPENLAENTARAGQRASDAEIEAAALGAQAAQESKAASQASRAQQSTQTKAAKAAAQAGKTKKQFLGDADKADKNQLRFGRARNESGQAAESALEEAQAAAVKAREAATDARAKVAVGEISKADFSAAKAAAESAESNLELLTVAQRLHSGAPLKVVAGELSKQGKSVEQIRDVLTRARDRANSIVQPKSEIPFEAFWDKRKRLDSDIDFGKASDNLVDKVNKAGRSEMSALMDRVAEESNIPEFNAAMKSYSGKAKLIEELKAYIGQTRGTNERKVQQFIDHLLGKNSQHKQELIAAFDKAMGTNTLERAKAAQMAQQIGHDGEAAWFPMHNTGAMGAGQQWLGRIGFLWSSPVIASRVTLPAFSKVESLAKKFGNALPPKAGKLVTAIERAENPAKAAPLVNQLIQILEAESKLPDNAIPFRKVAENDDSSRYSRK